MSEPKITRRKLADYRPTPNNPNRHTERGLQVVEDSVNYNGAGRSGLADKDDIILAGNGTWEAMARAGVEDVIEVETDGHAWVIVKRTDIQDGEPRAEALKIADNRASELGYDPDPKMLGALLANIAAEDEALLRGAGFSDSELQALLDSIGGVTADDPGAQVDRADELNQVWQVQPGDLWEIGAHRLLCGDSTKAEDVARVMAGEKADAVVTDPPYGINATQMTLGTGKKHFYRGEWDNQRPNIRPILDIAPSVVIWGGNYFCDVLPVSNDWLCWYKNNDGLSFSEFELAWSNIGCNCRWLSHHWSGEEKNHPTQKPLPVVRWCVELLPQSQIIFDPFTGSGTTLVACEQLNRRGRGIEIEPKYCAVTLQRLADMGLEPQRLSNVSNI